MDDPTIEGLREHIAEHKEDHLGRHLFIPVQITTQNYDQELRACYYQTWEKMKIIGNVIKCSSHQA